MSSDGGGKQCQSQENRHTFSVSAFGTKFCMAFKKRTTKLDLFGLFCKVLNFQV